MIKRFILWFKHFLYFFKEGIWEMDIEEKPLKIKLWAYPLKITSMAAKGVFRRDVYKTSTSLTYYSLLSVVPAVALAFGIGKGFGLAKFVENQITNVFEGHEEIAQQVIGFSNSMLAQSSGGLIAGAGLVVLLFTIMTLLNRIEAAMNEVWMVESGRSFVQKVNENLTLIFLAPIVLVLSAGANVLLTEKIENLTEKYWLFQQLGPGLFFALQIIPVFFTGLLFMLVYLIFPNTRVDTKAALIGGIIAGFLYNVLQAIYLGFQVGVSSYNAVYGSFAILPLFLVWVNLSWMVLVLGAELTYAIQYVGQHKPNERDLEISLFSKKVIALSIMFEIIKAFKEETKAPSEEDLVHKLGLQRTLIQKLIKELTNAGLLHKEVIHEDKNINPQQLGLRPSKETNKLSLEEIIYHLEHKGVNDEELYKNSEKTVTRMSAQLKQHEQLIYQNTPKRTLVD